MLPSVDLTTSASATMKDFGAESTRPAPLPVYASPRRSRGAGARLATGLPATALAGLDSHQLDSVQRFHALIAFLLCHAFVALHVGFSVAMRTTSAAMPVFVHGRPGRRVFEPSYFLATSRRYHRKIVSGVTIPAMDASRRRPTTWPFTARRRRWSSVRRTRRDSCVARRTRFSSTRYSMTACCCRLTQPEKSRQKKASGGGNGSIAKACLRGYPDSR